MCLCRVTKKERREREKKRIRYEMKASRRNFVATGRKNNCETGSGFVGLNSRRAPCCFSHVGSHEA